MEIKDRILYLVAGIVVMTGLRAGSCSAGIVGRGWRLLRELQRIGGSGGGRQPGGELQAREAGRDDCFARIVARQSLYFSTYGRRGASPAARNAVDADVYDDFKGNQDFVMLAVSQDTKGRALSRRTSAKTGTISQFCSIRRTKWGDLRGERRARRRSYRPQRQIVAHHMGAFDWSRPTSRTHCSNCLTQKRIKGYVNVTERVATVCIKGRHLLK